MNIYENINGEIDTLYSRLQRLQNSSNKEDYEENKIKIAQDYNNGDIYYDNSETDAERKK